VDATHDSPFHNAPSPAEEERIEGGRSARCVHSALQGGTDGGAGGNSGGGAGGNSGGGGGAGGGGGGGNGGGDGVPEQGPREPRRWMATALSLALVLPPEALLRLLGSLTAELKTVPRPAQPRGLPALPRSMAGSLGLAWRPALAGPTCAVSLCPAFCWQAWGPAKGSSKAAATATATAALRVDERVGLAALLPELSAVAAAAESHAAAAAAERTALRALLVELGSQLRAAAERESRLAARLLAERVTRSVVARHEVRQCAGVVGHAVPCPVCACMRLAGCSLLATPSVLSAAGGQPAGAARRDED
jgi:hypothetical protein